MSWKTLKHPGSRRIKKAFFVLRSSTFKIKPRRPLKKAFFVLRSSFFQDQAPTALWINNHPPIQDQAPTALEESVLRSSFINCSSSRINPQRPLWIDNINESAHPLFIKPKPRRPLKEAFIVHHCSSRSSLKALEDLFEPKSPRKSVHHCSSRSSPKALEDPFILVHPRSSLDGPWINRTSHKSTPYGDRIRGQIRERL
ncbi:hypothetical protein PS1_034845 [Malus domestica]